MLATLFWFWLKANPAAKLRALLDMLTMLALYHRSPRSICFSSLSLALRPSRLTQLLQTVMAALALQCPTNSLAADCFLPNGKIAYWRLTVRQDTRLYRAPNGS